MVDEKPRCTARARHKIVKHGEPHTFPCQREAGHDGAHEHKKDTRTGMWWGDAPLPDNTKLRFGKWLEDK